MVIVTRGRGRIDTLCQMLCRFHAQITQQQRHRLRASQTAGIAKDTQPGGETTNSLYATQGVPMLKVTPDLVKEFGS